MSEVGRSVASAAHEGSNPRRWEEPRRRSIFGFRVSLFLGISWLVLCDSVGAFELRSAKTVLIPQSERIEGDLYVAAEILVIDGWVHGDVVAVGREIRINGRVDGDLLVAAQVVSIVGGVGDDARVAGMVVSLAPGSQGPSF